MTKPALALICCLASVEAAAQDARFPWKAGDRAPEVAGLQLATSRTKMASVLGMPSDSQSLGADVWTYGFSGKGLLIVYARQDGVIEIHVLRRDAGSIGGVRVGDAEDEVRARWGAPTEAESIDAGEETSYIAGKWMVVVVYDTVTRRVKELWLGPPSDRD